MSSRSATLIALLCIFVLGVLTLLAVSQNNALPTTTPSPTPKIITSFEECVAAGFPIMESFPPQCHDGQQTFTQVIVATPTPTVNITVTAPTPNQIITSPLTVTGTARVFENVFQVRVKDANDQILIERFGTANSPDIGQFGPYSIQLVFADADTPTGTVEVFTYSAKDGSEIDKVIIPVRFQ